MPNFFGNIVGDDVTSELHSKREQLIKVFSEEKAAAATGDASKEAELRQRRESLQKEISDRVDKLKSTLLQGTEL
jgi:hypothetical protein